MCTVRGTERSSVVVLSAATGHLLHQVREPCGGVGAAERARRLFHREQAGRVGEERVELAGEARAVELAVGHHHRGPGAREHLRVPGLVIAGRAGQRHEHRRHADHRELGGHAAGSAQHERGVRVERVHVVLVADEPVVEPVAGARADASRSRHSS